MKIKISRKTRKLGWGYTTVCKQGLTGLYVPPPIHPTYVGTISHIFNEMEADKTFASIKSGGTYFSTAWFYRNQRIRFMDETPWYLVNRFVDHITAELEE